jgi:cellulose synthase/poly-beta-1,6-N-acetylglucosamine synthase-like glycosyltransferase
MPCLNAWFNDQFLGEPTEHGYETQFNCHILGGTKYYIDNQKRAWKVRYSGKALCYFEAPPTVRQFIREKIRWKKGEFRVAILNIPFFFKNRCPVISIHFYLEPAFAFLYTFVLIMTLVLLPLKEEDWDTLVYNSGIFFVGLSYSLDFSIRHNDTKMWPYRILWHFRVVLVGFPVLLCNFIIRDKSWLTR